MANVKMKPMPEFSTEEDERKFWAEHDSTEFMDWASADVPQAPEPEANLAYDLAPPAGFHDRGFESIGEPAGRAVPVSLEGVPGRTPGERATAGVVPFGLASIRLAPKS